MWLGIFWCQRGPVIIPINSTYMYKFYVDIDYQCLTMGDYEGIATKEIPASEIIGQEEPPTQYPSYQYHFEHKVPLVSFDWNWKSINDRKQ